jgi:hypothetical protein
MHPNEETSPFLPKNSKDVFFHYFHHIRGFLQALDVKLIILPPYPNACAYNFQLQVVIGGSGVAVDPHEDGVEAGGDESQRKDVLARVRTFVRRVAEADGAALQAPLVRDRF